GQTALELRAPPLGVEHFAAFAIGGHRHELQRDLAIVARVVGEEHRRHAAVPDLAHDPVGADVAEDGRHLRPRPLPRPAGGAGAGMNQLSLASADAIALCEETIAASGRTWTNVLAAIDGWAPASRRIGAAARSDVAFL